MIWKLCALLLFVLLLFKCLWLLCNFFPIYDTEFKFFHDIVIVCSPLKREEIVKCTEDHKKHDFFDFWGLQNIFQRNLKNFIK